MDTPWNPSRSFEQCDALLTGPDCPFEVTELEIDGKLLKVYKNIEPVRTPPIAALNIYN
jgi:hypothetical protein